MKLDPNCIRCILLYVEDNSTFSKSITYSFDSIPEYLNAYSHEKIIYHISQCFQSGLLSNVHFYENGKIIKISDLTPSGHEFLSNIRDDSLWKKILSKASGASLPIIYEIAKNLASKYFLD